MSGVDIMFSCVGVALLLVGWQAALYVKEKRASAKQAREIAEQVTRLALESQQPRDDKGRTVH